MSHPDPEWWKRCGPSDRLNVTDLCDHCGHIRDLHTQQGCTAAAASLDSLADFPCRCTNSPLYPGTLWRNPCTLEPKVKR